LTGLTGKNVLDIMNNTDIPPDVLDTTVDDYFIKVIANKYLISWEELGPVLGFTYAQERAISRSVTMVNKNIHFCISGKI
jgi:hypothetical protein